MIQLRDYQQDLLDGVHVALDSEQARVMMQLPTGGGKTVIAGALLNAWLKGGRKAVWLTHRKELVTQTRELLANAKVATSVDARWKPGDDAPARRNRVAILMAQTVSRRTAGKIVWTKYSNDDLMIIDEAHHAAAAGWTRAMQQWPGRILGMTATPWRLSHKEGFDHLFSAMLCGPSVVDLQSGNYLCGAQVLRPSSQWVIRGGEIGMDGDFTDAGIEAANQANIMTAGGLKFWQEHAQDRQTIIYAVSVDHARNLAAFFRDAGVPAAAMLGSTKDKERAALIAAFKNGYLKVLVNVAVATEGFDLPDASCVVITRPTRSLTLYLQMVGRGLRPKKDGGNCLILDLAANAELHGLPGDDREWSLEPRAEEDDVGDAVTVWCERCDTVSPAASHTCQNCDAPFGKECSRCGTWRAWKRWSLEKQCGDAHEFVCDLCHWDAHIEARLPISEQLEAELSKLEDEEERLLLPDYSELDADLNGRLFELLKELLEEEQLKTKGADEKRQHEVRKSIINREEHFADESLLEGLFENYIIGLPSNINPQSNLQKYRMFNEWEGGLRRELESWKDELARLDNMLNRKQRIFDRVKQSVFEVLKRAAEDIDLLPDPEEERGMQGENSASTSDDLIFSTDVVPIRPELQSREAGVDRGEPVKLEVGESLCYSYLRHVKSCWLVQTNWKSSEHWATHRTEKELEEMFQEMRQEFDPDGSVFKRTASVAQFMQQGEIDVVGVDQNGNIHALDVAFHEAGLNYGEGAANRVLKKVLRTYVLLNAYHPAGTNHHIYFVSPKVHPAVQAPLEGAFAGLREKYSETMWHLITNADFSESVIGETLARADTVADTSELFVRSVKLLNLSGYSEVKEQNTYRVNAQPMKRSVARGDGIQPLVRDLMQTLLERCPTLLDQEDLSNLKDAQYCNNTLLLKIRNHALLRERHQGRMVSGHSRYWKGLYAGRFYVCSEWWKDNHLENAKSLLRFLKILVQRKPHHADINELEDHIAALDTFIEGYG